jgi:hypothetical protein
MPASKARRERYLQKLAVDQGRLPEPAEEPQPAPAPAPEPEPDGAGDLDFTVPPGGLLSALDVLPRGLKTTVLLTPAETAYWQLFAMRNRDLKVFTKTVRALLRVLMAEEHDMAERARAEARRTGRPVQPAVGPFTQAVRDEMRQVRAEG